MIKTLESAQNPEIKKLKALLTRKGREQQGCFLAEGVRLLETALEAGAPIRAIYGCPELFKDSRTRSLWDTLGRQVKQAFLLPPRLFKEVSDTETPQGILAALALPSVRPEDLSQREKVLFLLLDGVQDPGNLGTILRTADAAGVDAVFYTAGTVDPLNPKVVRASMGSIFHLPVLELTDPAAAAAGWKQAGILCYAAQLEGAEDLYSLRLPEKAAFFLGNEAQGLSPQIAALADQAVKIPILGRAESLNVAMAAGILVYEAVRQRRQSTAEGRH